LYWLNVKNCLSFVLYVWEVFFSWIKLVTKLLSLLTHEQHLLPILSWVDKLPSISSSTTISAALSGLCHLLLNKYGFLIEPFRGDGHKEWLPFCYSRVLLSGIQIFLSINNMDPGLKIAGVTKKGDRDVQEWQTRRSFLRVVFALFVFWGS